MSVSEQLKTSVEVELTQDVFMARVQELGGLSMKNVTIVHLEHQAEQLRRRHQSHPEDGADEIADMIQHSIDNGVYL